MVITVLVVAILGLAFAIGAALLVYRGGKRGMAAALVLVGIVVAIALVVALMIALLPGGGQTPIP